MMNKEAPDQDRRELPRFRLREPLTEPKLALLADVFLPDATGAEFLSSAARNRILVMIYPSFIGFDTRFTGA